MANPDTFGAAPQRRSVLIDVTLLTAIALGVRLIRLDMVPEVDELHHVLAARSLLDHGTLDIGGVPYTRASAFTYIIAGIFGLVGENLIAARIPALIAGTLLVVAVFLWVRSVAGRGAGWVSALLLALYWNAIRLSDLTRFYTLQTLLFFCGSIAVFELVTRPPPRRRTTLLVAAAAICFMFALHLQILTAVGLAGLAVWVAAVAGPDIVRRIAAHPRRVWITAAAVVAIAALVTAVIWSGQLQTYWRMFRYADAWAEETRYNVRYYHWMLLEQYATLWTLFPVLLIAAIAAHRRAAWMCAVVFGVALVFQSLAAWKHPSYIFYAMPMFFALCGMGLAELYPWVRSRLERVIEGIVPRMSIGARRATTTVVLVVAALFAVIGNGAFSLTVRQLTGAAEAGSTEQGDGNWAAAEQQLRPYLDGAGVLITSSDLKAMYFFDRADYMLLVTRLEYANGRDPEFRRSTISNVRVISTPASLQRLMRCYASGIVVIENGHWRKAWGVPPETAEFIERTLTPVPLEPRWKLRAFTWRSAVEAAAPCDRPKAAGGQRRSDDLLAGAVYSPRWNMLRASTMRPAWYQMSSSS
ncbi:MAG TPA: hypothetical protein VJ596_05045 [Gemmatimonadaceae bacterium]|nr:hypothetical protein [Gemmatimonadaceae bacterium]